MASQTHSCTVTPKPKVQPNSHVDEEQAVGHPGNAIAEIPHAVKNSVETGRYANKKRHARSDAIHRVHVGTLSRMASVEPKAMCSGWASGFNSME